MSKNCKAGFRRRLRNWIEASGGGLRTADTRRSSKEKACSSPLVPQPSGRVLRSGAADSLVPVRPAHLPVTISGIPWRRPQPGADPTFLAAWKKVFSRRWLLQKPNRPRAGAGAAGTTPAEGRCPMARMSGMGGMGYR